MKKMVLYNIQDNINMQQLYNFFQKFCSSFSIETDYTEKLSMEEIDRIQQELINYFESENKYMQEAYNLDSDYHNSLKNTLHFTSDDTAKKYFRKIHQENMHTVKDISFKICKKGKKYNPIIKQGYLGNKVTRVTENSVGGVYNILYYDIHELNLITCRMKNIYDYIWIGKTQFWNLTFYNNKRKHVLSINTDRQEINCCFNDIMYEQFSKLNIDSGVKTPES